MFENNWSAEQIEQNLQQGRGAFFASANGEQIMDPPRNGPSSPVVNELATVLDKMSGVLEAQNLLRSEVDSLRGEVVGLKRERAALEERYKKKIASLEQEVEKLRSERAELIEQFFEQLRNEKGTAAPPRAFLGLPLVIKTEQQEFLGVAGKTKHFSLQEFVRIIEQNAGRNKTVTLNWKAKRNTWILTIKTKDALARKQHEHILEVIQTVTPSKNKVAQITSLIIDGNPVPDPFLLVLFRKIKDGFDD